MSLFTPVQGIIGGSLIGGSAGVLLVLNGDIMGASGILSNTLINPMKAIQNPKNHWRYVYLASFALSVNLFVNYLAPKEFMADDRSKDSDVPVASTWAYLLGGFFVGMGTKIGNGCTTGHGICGIARFSKRSLFATCTFTGCSMLTTYLTSPLRSWSTVTAFLRATGGIPKMSSIGSGLFMATSVLAAMVSPALTAKNRSDDKQEAANEDRKVLGAALSGIMFAAGLAISGMAKASKVHDFLCLSGLGQQGTYDPTLMAVMGAGILSSWASYQLVQGWSMIVPQKKALTCPIFGGKFSVPTNTTIDGQLAMGAATFGLGWGLTGICPGPAIFAAASGNVHAALLWLPAFVAGSSIGTEVKSMWNNAAASTKKKKAA